MAFVVAGCKAYENPFEYEVPTSYNFENVSYSGQTDRLNMLEEMTTYMKTANTMGTTLDAQVLRDMFENANDPFSFTAEKQLKDKCIISAVATIESYFDKIALASQSTVAGSNGVAGVVSNGIKSYLCDENGIEYTQLIEKGLMAAVFYYQATAVYLGEGKIGPDVDNETVEAGKGTDMEHHWDEAFGYLGVPTDFPANTDDARFYGKYCNSRDAVLGTNSALMNAFLKGRAAISNNDMVTKDIAVTLVRDTWERVIAATAISYINGGKADIADDALRNHQLSEAIAFVTALRYNPTKKISDTDIQAVLDYIGTNLYEVTITGLDNARDLLSAVYKMDAVKDQL